MYRYTYLLKPGWKDYLVEWGIYILLTSVVTTIWWVMGPESLVFTGHWIYLLLIFSAWEMAKYLRRPDPLKSWLYSPFVQLVWRFMNWICALSLLIFFPFLGPGLRKRWFIMVERSRYFQRRAFWKTQFFPVDLYLEEHGLPLRNDLRVQEYQRLRESLGEEQHQFHQLRTLAKVFWPEYEGE